MRNPGWYLQRLKGMSPVEIPYRIGQIVNRELDRILAERRTPQAGDRLRIPRLVDRASTLQSELPDFATRVVDEADRIIAHDFRVFGIPCNYGDPINWHLDPETGRCWPLKFWGDIDYRDGFRVGGIKFAWEINRLHHFPTLGLAFAMTDERKYREEIFRQLSSWTDANPYPKGINWISGIELGIRIVNLIYAVAFVDPEQLSQEERDSISKFVVLHARHLYRYPSRYSSCANHAIAEALGLFLAGLCLPGAADSERWRRYGKQVLEREVTRQILSDGSGFEYSLAYLEFLLEHYLIYLAMSEEFGERPGEQVGSRVYQAGRFLRNLADRCGNVPAIGDDDDGHVLALGEQPGTATVELLNTVAVLTGDPDLLIETADLDPKTVLLLGGNAGPTWRRLRQQVGSSPPSVALFEKAGLAVLRPKFGREVVFVGNASDLGLPPLAGHGHADALSFWLSIGGIPVFVDPGTYLYQGGGIWRHYFRSTRAHNTLIVDGQDQARSIADFIFGDPYRILENRTEMNEETMSWTATHDAYLRLEDPVTHCRTVSYSEDQRCFVIEDRLSCDSTHAVVCQFHLAPSCSVQPEGRRAFVIENDQSRIRLVFQDGWRDTERIKGDDTQPVGWYSPGFNRRVPTWTIRGKSDIEGSTTLVCEIQLQQ